MIAHKREQQLSYWNQFPEIGIRFPDHLTSQKLVETVQSPLITTSANLAGQQSPVQPDEIPGEILDQIDCLLDGGTCQHKIPSTIVKIEFEKKTYQIVREGAFPKDQFARIFKELLF